MRFVVIRKLLFACCVVWMSPAVMAGVSNGPEDSSGDLDALARRLANPVHTLTWLSGDIDYRGYSGSLPEADDMTGLAWRVSGGLAKVLDSGRHWQFDLAIPVNVQLPAWIVNFGDPIWELNRDYGDFLLRQSPQVTPSTGEFKSAHGHVSDVTFQLGYGQVVDGGLSWRIGLAGVFPSSQDVSVSRDQGLIGPDLALGLERDWGVLGARFTHLVNVTGDERFDTNETHIEATATWNLANHWQAFTRPGLTYDWEGDSGNHWLLPVSAGLARTFRVSRWPVRAGAEAVWYVKTADRLGVEWQCLVSLTAVLGSG